MLDGAETRAFYRGLRQRTRTAGREAAREAVDEQVRHAKTTTGDGRHLGGWKNQTERLHDSIRATKDRTRSTPDRHVYVISANPQTEGAEVDYAVHLEKRGFWVISGLGERAAVWFRQLMHLRLQRLD